MLRKAMAIALLCLTLLLCGLDTSAVGAPAESDTALHALVHGHDAGARGSTELLAAAFVAVVLLVLVTTPPNGRRTVGRMMAVDDAEPPAAWFTSLAERGPPSFS